MDTLAKQLRHRRTELGLTQAELAELAETSERFVRALEAGKSTARLDKVMAVAHALGLELRAQLRGTP